MCQQKPRYVGYCYRHAKMRGLLCAGSGCERAPVEGEFCVLHGGTLPKLENPEFLFSHQDAFMQIGNKEGLDFTTRYTLAMQHVIDILTTPR
jgi:uncharacterized protein (DUF2267 family)